MNTPTDRATLPTFLYVLDQQTGVRSMEFADANGERYDPPRRCGMLPVVAQANTAPALADALRELVRESTVQAALGDVFRDSFGDALNKARAALRRAGLES
jgi:secreted protein with Ig-like and vWFA domain